MARPPLRQLRPRPGSPEAASEPYASLALFSGQLSRAIEERADARAERLGKEIGEREALEGTFTEREGRGLLSAAINSAGLAAVAARAENEIASLLSALAVKHQRDPSAFAAEAAEAKAALMSRIGEATPSLRSTAGLEFDRRAGAARAKIAAAVAEDQRAENIAQVTIAKDRARETMLRSTRSGDLESALAARDNYIGWLQTMKLFGGTDKVKALEELAGVDREMMFSARLGDIDRAVLQGNGFTMVDQLLKARGEDEHLTIDEEQKLIAFARAEANAWYSRRNKGRDLLDREAKLEGTRRYLEARARVIAGEDITADIERLQRVPDNIQPTAAQIAELQDLNLRARNEGVDDPDAVRALVSEIDAGLAAPGGQWGWERRLRAAWEQGDITTKTRFELADRAESEAEDVLTNPEYKANLRELMQALGYDPASGFGFSVDNSLVLSRAAGYYRQLVTVEGMPAGLARAKALELFQSEQARTRTVGVRPPYATVGDVWRAFRRGEISDQTTALHLAEQVEAWRLRDAVQGRARPEQDAAAAEALRRAQEQ